MGNGGAGASTQSISSGTAGLHLAKDGDIGPSALGPDTQTEMPSGRLCKAQRQAHPVIL